ncbi:MAG TPA: AbgT family transporter [Halanaerobiales bacterium]|nr:AbgT family transporter [Halanaerobiales bacterium]
MNKNQEVSSKKKWYKRIPNAYVLLMVIIVLVTILTYIIPAGEFAREEMSNGRIGVIPGSFEFVEQSPVGILGLLQSIPKGMISGANIIFIVFFAGALFNVIESTGALENGLGVIVQKLKGSSNAGQKMIWIMTFVFGALGAVVGFENNIALIPIGVMIALAMGYDLMVGAGIAIGGIGLGFATSPINPYTVGVSHAIAELPMFSGFGLRFAFMVVTLIVLAHHTASYGKKVKSGDRKSLIKNANTEDIELSKEINEYELNGTHKQVIFILFAIIATIIYGTLQHHWYIIEISTVFMVGAILTGIVAKYDSDKLVDKMIEGASRLTSGALIIGVARGLTVILQDGKIGDTITYALSVPLEQFPPLVSGWFMTISHSIINFFIPGGSGQAMATMPIMVPLSDLVGLTRQTAVIAFQIGDGVMNLIVPTLGGLLAMLALARVPFEKWFKFIYPMVLKVLVVGWIFIAIATFIGY